MTLTKKQIEETWRKHYNGGNLSDYSLGQENCDGIAEIWISGILIPLLEGVEGQVENLMKKNGGSIEYEAACLDILYVLTHQITSLKE